MRVFMNNFEMRKIDEVKGYENNPRFNSKAIGIVANSIREFGFINPIVVDNNGVVIVGHTRLEASRVLGYQEVPVIVAAHLNENQVKAFRIMDNKSGEVAEWDYSKLLGEIEDLKVDDYDIDLTGFKEEDLAEFVDDLIAEADENEDKPEFDFTSELLEEHNYVVLYFDNSLDWQVAKEVLGIKTVDAFASKEGYEKKGIGRVIKGSDVINKMNKDGEKYEF